jgi:hypothetical protein
MVPKSLTQLTPVLPQPTICRHRSVEQMADKRGFVRRNRGLFNRIQDQIILTRNYKEIYFEAAKHR